MSLANRILGTDPAVALTAAVERLGVRVDRDAVIDRFERHPSPRSLKAVVEIAPELGVEARAFRSDVAGLADATTPALVHLVDPGAEDSGFGVLVEIGPGHVVIDEAEGEKPRTLNAREFEACWSGVVVTLAVREGAAPVPELRHGGVLLRLRAWYRRDEPLARAALVARRTAGAVLAVLALAAAWRQGAAVAGIPGALLGSLVAGLAGVGVVASRELFFRSRRTLIPGTTSRLSSSICGRGTFTDCLGVLSSRFSRFAGIDWGSVGVALFSSNLVLLAAGAVLGAEHRGLLFAWLAVAYVLALPGSLVLTAVQIYPLRRFCPLCMIVHVAVIVPAALGIAWLARGGWPASPVALLPFALAHAGAVLGSFGLVVPWLSLDLESTVNRTRLGWIGATPWGALAEMAGMPRATRNVPEATIRLGDPSALFRLEALVHPMCTGCGPVVQQLLALEERHAGRLTIGFHVAPRDVTSRADGEMCAAIAAVGLTEGGPEGVATFMRAKNAPWPALRAAEGGAEKAVEHLRPGTSVPEAILDRARQAVTAADRLSEALERGTPTLLLHGRFWDASVADLDRLLDRHSDLLAAVLRLSPPAAATAPSPSAPARP